jgi:hypothetical protein
MVVSVNIAMNTPYMFLLTQGSHNIPSWVSCYFFYTWMIFLTLCITNLHQFCLLMIQVYSLLTQKSLKLIQIIIVFATINTLFKNIYLSLNLKKTYYIHFKTRNSPSIDMKIGLNNRSIPSALSSKFLELTIGSTLSRKIQIDHLTNKLSTGCYVIRSVKPLMSHKTLLLIYHSLFPTVTILLVCLLRITRICFVDMFCIQWFCNLLDLLNVNIN